MQMSRKLVAQLQKLFASMMMTNVKYLDPSPVLHTIVDDSGQKIRVHEQADICEFFLNFLDRLQDGLAENKKLIRKMMGQELQGLQNQPLDLGTSTISTAPSAAQP